MQTDEPLENTSTSTWNEQAVRVNVNPYEVADMLALAREMEEKKADLS